MSNTKANGRQNRPVEALVGRQIAEIKEGVRDALSAGPTAAEQLPALLSFISGFNRALKEPRDPLASKCHDTARAALRPNAEANGRRSRPVEHIVGRQRTDD